MKLKALIVDIHKKSRNDLFNIVSEVGVEPYIFSKSEEALTALKSNSFDFIIVSQELDEISGELFLYRAAKISDIVNSLTILVADEASQERVMSANTVGFKLIFQRKDFDSISFFLRDVVNRKLLDLEGRVLYIEADETASIETLEVFSRYKSNLEHVTNLPDAITCLNSKNYDLVICSLQLHSIDAASIIVDLLRLSKDMDKARIPVLVVANDADEFKRIALLKNGASDFIQAPYHHDELIVRASNLLVAKKTLDYANRQQRKALKLAMTDQLTGLYNRHSLFEIASKYIADSKRHKYPLSILVLDLDYFKNINDTQGHATGDVVLKQLGALLSTNCRNEDFVARFGGEEFVMLLSRCDIDAASQKAEEIREKVSKLTPAGINITVSIGAAELEENQNFEDVFKKADKAVYSAKEQGRDRVITAVK